MTPVKPESPNQASPEPAVPSQPHGDGSLKASSDEAARLWQNYEKNKKSPLSLSFVFYLVAGLLAVVILVAGLYIVAFK